jgi:predicted lipid-binding transport protein (Tim44 family)
MRVASLILAVVMGFAGLAGGTDASAAKRFGGGKSVGKQSDNVSKQAAPAATPNATNATPAAAAAAKPAAPAVAPKKPWGAMLGGLAAGLGLAWLASSLGLGEAFGQFLMIGLVVMLAMVAIGFFLRWRKQNAEKANGSGSGPYALQGAGAAVPRNDYSPSNVGNDASARPWERNSMAFEAPKAGGSMIGSALIGSNLSSAPAGWGVPEGFDTVSFLAASKSHFMTLQAAWDKVDLPVMRAMMTDDMLAEIRAQLNERESISGSAANQTDVVMLDAKLLGIEELPETWMASVEYSGMIREDLSQGPHPFREVWNLSKAKSGNGGWLVAGVQALS